MWYVYQILNKNIYRYIGITQNPIKRLIKHNQGSTKSTRPYIPFIKINILKTCQNRQKARKWEKYYKSGVGREFFKQNQSGCSVVS